ncbi:MAG TPA: helix-turn-helix transcriptional regulator [Trebonia sp.]
MSIGATLVAARQAAGLTVAEVSERTRIRPALIRSIERDDFAACGGDFYARGHIRAIARTVGTDSVPLVEEYDAIHPAGHSPGRPPSIDDLLDGPVRLIDAPGTGASAADDVPSGAALPVPAGRAGPSGGDALPGGGVHEDATAEAGDDACGDAASDNDASVGESQAGSGADDDVPASAGPGAIDDIGTASHEWFPGWYARQPHHSPHDTADDLAGTGAAGYSDPGYAIEPAAGISGGAGAGRTAGHAGRGSHRLRSTWQLASLALVALAVIGIGGYWAAVFPGARSAASPRTQPPTASKAGLPSANGHGVTPSAAASPSASAAPSPSQTGTRVAGVSPVSAKAYGPDGTSDGDNPQSASGALSGSASSEWQSQWYATAEFGNLKSGTGLLVGLARTVTATGVTINLGDTSGATIEVRAGTSPGSLRTLGTASGTGGSVHLSFASHPSVQYLLVWFTQLPVNSEDGNYQAAVSGVTVTALKG